MGNDTTYWPPMCIILHESHIFCFIFCPQISLKIINELLRMTKLTVLGTSKIKKLRFKQMYLNKQLVDDKYL